MGTPDIVIARAGLVCPIGLSLPEAAASARARVARLREISWLDARLDPFVAGVVPDDGLPELAEALHGAGLTHREARMLRLAHAAIEEALSAWLAAGGPALPVLVGLPEHHPARPVQPATFLQQLSQQCPGAIDPALSLAVPRGRAASLMALREACARVTRGDAPAVLVGGVDTLVDLTVLAMLDLQGRVRNPVNSDGFSPSEGAAFLLVMRADLAQARGLKPLARVLGTALGHEPGHLYAQEPYKGEGLAAALDSLLAEAPAPAPIATVYSSFNGERHWAREFGVARLRQSHAFQPEHAMEHPAECFGDLGAAHGAALMALAAHALQGRYRASPCLVYASSDRGDRVASLIDLAA